MTSENLAAIMILSTALFSVIIIGIIIVRNRCR